MEDIWAAKWRWVLVWRRARGPFPLPYRLAGHCCRRHYEHIDIDMVGCVLCGHVHLCSALASDVGRLRRQFNRTGQTDRRQDVDTACEKVVADSHVVCLLTGFCLEERVLADDEFVDTVAPAPVCEAAPVRVAEDAVAAIVGRILYSQESQRCHASENERFGAKLTGVLQRILREHKMAHPGAWPNLVGVSTALAARTRNMRQCAEAFDLCARRQLAEGATVAIARLLHVLQAICPQVLSAQKFETFVVGLLYLMRAGLLTRDTYILPRVPALCTHLPLESHLQPYFGIRCKSITEVENLVKMQIRHLGTDRIRALGLGDPSC